MNRGIISTDTVKNWSVSTDAEKTAAKFGNSVRRVGRLPVCFRDSLLVLYEGRRLSRRYRAGSALYCHAHSAGSDLHSTGIRRPVLYGYSYTSPP